MCKKRKKNIPSPDSIYTSLSDRIVKCLDRDLSIECIASFGSNQFDKDSKDHDMFIICNDPCDFTNLYNAAKRIRSVLIQDEIVVASKIIEPFIVSKYPKHKRIHLVIYPDASWFFSLQSKRLCENTLHTSTILKGYAPSQKTHDNPLPDWAYELGWQGIHALVHGINRKDLFCEKNRVLCSDAAVYIIRQALRNLLSESGGDPYGIHTNDLICRTIPTINERQKYQKILSNPPETYNKLANSLTIFLNLLCRLRETST